MHPRGIASYRLGFWIGMLLSSQLFSGFASVKVFEQPLILTYYRLGNVEVNVPKVPQPESNNELGRMCHHCLTNDQSTS